MIIAIVPYRLGLFVITIVVFEEAEWLVIADMDANLTLLAILTLRHVGAQDVDIVLWIWLAHAAWFRLDPWEGTERHRGLGLSESLVYLNASQLLEGLCHRWIHRLSRSGAIFEAAQVVLGEVLAYHETIDGRRGAERSDVILLYLAHNLLCRKLLMVINEDRGTGKPLSVELAPYRLAPTGVSYGEVDGVLMEIVPIHACGEMTKGIEMVMSHHLRLARGSRCEVHQQGVLVRVYMFWANERSAFVPFLHPVVESLRDVRTDANQELHGRTLRHRLLYLFYHIVVATADDGFHASRIVAVDDVVLGEHVGGRDGYGTELVKSEHGEPPLVVTLQDEHHLVIVTDAQALEVSGSLVALLLEVLICELDFLTTFAGP